VAILFVIVTGAVLSDASNFVDFFPYGADGVFQGAAFIFFSYVGFDTVSTLYDPISPQLSSAR